jgi:hypothetical protein
MTQRVFIVLGMHRSGTSVLAGSLEQAGVFLGHVVRSMSFNRKGLCENPVVFMMHDHLLAANGGSWAQPPSRVTWRPIHELVRDTVIDSFSQQRVWGFKDPRTVYTLKGWLNAVPNAELVGIFRHPALVAQSLAQRDATSMRDGLALWQAYNTELISWRKKIEFPILSFDDLDCSFEEQLGQLIRSKALPSNCEEQRFFERRYRHFDTSSTISLDHDICRTYEVLKEYCIGRK